jgi:sugar lactone lactonase YvrE
VSTAALRYPRRVLIDESGHMWIADTGHHRIVIADRHGAVRLVAGTGAPGSRDGAHGEASFDAPEGLAVTRAATRLYVADTGAHTIRRVDVDLAAGTAVVTTVAGTGARGQALPPGAHPVRSTALAGPCALAVDEEHDVLYVAMAGARQIWRVDLAAGAIESCAGRAGPEAMTGAVTGARDGARDRARDGARDGNGDAETGTGPAHQVWLGEPRGLALSPDRTRLYIADAGASAVRILHLTPGQATVETLIGAAHGMHGEAGDSDGSRRQARLRGCMDVTLSPAGLVIADAGNHALRGVNLRHGTVMTLWRGAGALALAGPGGVACDRAGRSYVVADTGHHRLVRVAADASSASELVLAPG